MKTRWEFFCYANVMCLCIRGRVMTYLTFLPILYKLFETILLVFSGNIKMFQVYICTMVFWNKNNPSEFLLSEGWEYHIFTNNLVKPNSVYHYISMYSNSHVWIQKIDQREVYYNGSLNPNAMLFPTPTPQGVILFSLLYETIGYSIIQYNK